MNINRSASDCLSELKVKSINQHNETQQASSVDDWSPFNTTNKWQHWCPNATCYNSPVCLPCQRRWLIIISSGRSGSTTLRRMMSELPGVRLSGENMNELEYTWASENVLNQSNNFRNGKKAFQHNPIPNGSMTCALQHIFEAINPPSESAMMQKNFDDSNSILGFKTIRFHNEHDNWTIDTAIEALLETFPCARIIVNIRSDIKALVNSRHDTYNKNADMKGAKRETAKLKTIAKRLGTKRARLIDMTEWSADNGLHILNDVLDWLGFENCRFNALYHENHDRYKQDVSTKIQLGKNCRYQYMN